MASAERKPDEKAVSKLNKEIRELEGKLAKRRGQRRVVEDSIILTLDEYEREALTGLLNNATGEAVLEKLGLEKKDDTILEGIWKILKEV